MRRREKIPKLVKMGVPERLLHHRERDAHTLGIRDEQAPGRVDEEVHVSIRTVPSRTLSLNTIPLVKFPCEPNRNSNWPTHG